MAELIATVLFWLQWGVLILVGFCAVLALAISALWCWATSVSYDDGDEE